MRSADLDGAWVEHRPPPRTTRIEKRRLLQMLLFHFENRLTPTHFQFLEKPAARASVISHLIIPKLS